eukprot:6213296-Pleurochrysis_carterae.AAC.1
MIGVPTTLSRTAFMNLNADALSATNGVVSTPILQFASYLSCMPNETSTEARQDAQVSAKDNE